MDHYYGARKGSDMAIANHEYFDHYKRSAITLIVLSQIIGACLAGGAAMFAWQTLSVNPLNAFTLGLVVLIAVNIVFGFVLFAVVSKPFKLLAQAVAHVSKDPVVTPPPMLDAVRYEHSGLKALIQTVYELAISSGKNVDEPNAQANPEPTGIYQQIAADLPCGLIALGKNGAILYANHIAPVKVTSEGGQTTTLQFEQNNSLTTWLADCEANKVRDTHLWQRVADHLPGEEGRRIFDVVGYYQKESPAGVAAILVAFDRTTMYESDQEDMDFIALAAHELRGPITVIRGYLDVIKNDMTTKFTPDEQELFDRLQVSSERLAGYVNNILNVSRYDRKQFITHLAEDNLVDIIKTLIPDLALRARTQRRKLTFSIPQGLPNIAADRSSLGEVVTNLVDNAIKYSHQDGEVLISAAVKDNAFVEVTVKDGGIGIPESVVGGLFNKFYRSHRSKQSVGGTGLGLYICKAIVESHGGSIWVRSHEGEGSTFGFTVPIYSTVAAKLQAGDNQNKDITQRSEGWIKNHAMYRR